MAYRKVITQLPAYDDKDERFLRNLLLLDVFPGGYARRPTDPPLGMRATYRRLIPLLRQLHRLGWEPITHAVSTGTGIRIERYGSTPGPLAFAVRNPFEAEVVNGFPVEYSRKGNELEVAVGIRGNDTTLLVVGDADAHATWRRVLADDRLDDVRLCLKEHALRHNIDEHPAWSSAAKLNHADTPEELGNVAKTIAGDTPTEVRARELLSVAAALVRGAREVKIVPSRTATLPREDSQAELPWSDTFEELSADRWALRDGEPADGIRVANGRLEMELPREATSAEIHTTRSWPFVPRPLVIESDFKFSHGDHDRYLRLSLKIAETAGAGEYLLVRIESTTASTGNVWVENHNAPPTQWQHTLTERKTFDPDATHHLRLRLERNTFRLELDDTLIGEGPHECEFGWANLTLGVYSGHRGQGDVCWWDNLKIQRAP